MRLIISLSLTLSALVLASPAEAAKTCKNFNSATATLWPTKIIAENTAITAWQARVTKRDALMYANWLNADQKRSDCKVTTSPVGANTWACTVTAKPCILQ